MSSPYGFRFILLLCAHEADGEICFVVVCAASRSIEPIFSPVFCKAPIGPGTVPVRIPGAQSNAIWALSAPVFPP